MPFPPVRANVAPAAIGAAGILVGVAGFQVALAAGAPLGEHVMGGTQERVLPTGMRVVAGGAAAALLVMASVVVRRAGLVDRPARWLDPATWGIAGFLGLNAIANLTSSSDLERFVFGPAAATAGGLTALVARRTGR